jgi:hypothetical protein
MKINIKKNQCATYDRVEETIVKWNSCLKKTLGQKCCYAATWNPK